MIVYNKNKLVHKSYIPVAGRVTTQDKKIFLNVDQFTALVDFMKPMQTTEPTLQWVVLIGRPTLLANNTVNAAPSSTENPLKYTKQK